MKKITVITPVFNGKVYIEKCLENVIQQACPEVEHLVMDGASTDGTAEIVRTWAEKYPHIRLVSEQDKGQSDAMNKGIGLAEGKIISFLNVDDFYEPGVLNQVLEIFEDLPEPSFVCGNLNIWNADGSLRHFNKPTRIGLPELVSNCFEWPYNPAAYFYHKSLHEKTGPYNAANHHCMDYEFIVEAAFYTELRYMDQTWGNFCVVEDSKTKNAHGDALKIAFEAGETIRQKAKERLTERQLEELEQILSAQKPLLLPEEKASPSFFQKVKAKIRKAIS
jgi:glycosyltransferase involved in cell wall biosynthesis